MTYNDYPANADKLRDMLEGLEDETFVPPGATAGLTDFVFTGGNVASAFPEIQSLFEANKGESFKDGQGNEVLLYYDDENNRLVRGDEPGAAQYEPVLDHEGNQKVLYNWQTLVVVYQSDDCQDNPGNWMRIVGFATVHVHAINGSSESPQHRIFATVLCDEVNYGRGSGAQDYGTVGSLAGLVE
jgi:hypothetical protein